jgi:hypothetical protein
MAGEALSGGGSTSNGGSDAGGREVLVGEIIASEPAGGRTSNGSSEVSGEGRDNPPLP